MPRDHWFEDLADHMGRSYDRYAHTKGTVQEVDHLVDVLSLRPGERVLDVGCGTGRHARELAGRGLIVHGIDISRRFVDIARDGAPGGATFERADARSLEVDGEFDAVVCLCQGAFGMMTADGDDDAVVAGMARALRRGGRLALSAFNAYFAVKYHDGADFDAASGVGHERTEIHDEEGRAKTVDLWTGCYTPRELRLLLGAHGLVVDSISSVEPGAYGAAPPTVESPEFLVVARTRRPHSSPALVGELIGGSRYRRGVPIARFSLVALDCPDPYGLAQFYSRIVGGEPEPQTESGDWVLLKQPGGIHLAFQQDLDHEPPDWPEGAPQQSHLDFDVDDLDEGERAVLAVGARKAAVQPRPDSWRVFLDPAGHPFCLVLA